jgi:putative ABC transport system ATP-binding protein
MSDNSNLISISNLSQSFTSGDEKLDILRNVSFDIKKESFNIIYGQSGSGKSTLLNTISGLQKPTAGKVLFQNSPLYDHSLDELARFRAEKIGIVYQTNYWVKSLNVIENVSLPLYFLGYSRVKAEPLARQALERVGMAEYADRQAFFLSGGEQQRVAIARGIINNPILLIADEPTGNLDTKNGDMIIKMMRDYIAGHGTLIMVTHNMEYLPLADHLLHIQDGSVQDLKSSNYQQMTNELMGDMKARIDSLAKLTKADSR